VGFPFLPPLVKFLFLVGFVFLLLLLAPVRFLFLLALVGFPFLRPLVKFVFLVGFVFLLLLLAPVRFLFLLASVGFLFLTTTLAVARTNAQRLTATLARANA
jgi:hypothetical protein